MKLYFPEIDFAAAHYIPGHPKCGGVHGHNYFVRNLEIEVTELDDTGMSIDFGKIKDYFKEQWDHKFIVPDSAGGKWIQACMDIDPFIALKIKPLRHTTAEWMALRIQQDLILDLDLGVDSVHFELWEGPHQAVKI